MKSIELQVGRLQCRPLRDYLNGCKFKGMAIEYFEGSGFLKRDFIIRGLELDIGIIDRDLRSWIAKIKS